MTVLAIVLVGFFAYIFGFLLGLKFEIKPKIHKIKIKKQEKTEIQKDYENFLNYDGTVQQ